MQPYLKPRARAAAAVLAILGIAVFAYGLPSRLPGEQVETAKTAYAEWEVRHNADITHGRPSTAGPPPNTNSYTRGTPALVVFGFVLCLLGGAVMFASLI